MKKVLLIIFAGMFSFTQANANILGDASITMGLGYSESVFAATGLIQTISNYLPRHPLS